MKKIIMLISCIGLINSGSAQIVSGNWAYYLAETGVNYGHGVVADHLNNVYYAGGYKQGSTENIFIEKRTSSGSLAWKKFLNSTGSNSEARAIDWSNNGNVVVGGFFNGQTDFDPNAGTVNRIPLSGHDAFATILDDNGNYIQDIQLACSGDALVYNVAVDAQNNIILTGYFDGTIDFDPTPAQYIYNTTGTDRDVFIAKYDSTGSILWAKKFTGAGNDYGYGLDVDGSGDIYLSGRFSGTMDADPGAGINNLVSVGGDDAYIIKLSSTGSFQWAKQLGSVGLDFSRAIKVDGADVYFALRFNAAIDLNPDSGTLNVTPYSSGITHTAVIKLSASSGTYSWAKYLWGPGNTDILDLDVDNNGYVFAVGGAGYVSAAYPNPSFQFSLGSSSFAQDAFVWRISSSGVTNPSDEFTFGGTGQDFARGISIAANNKVYVTGDQLGTVDFTPFSTPLSVTAITSKEAFIVEYEQQCNNSIGPVTSLVSCNSYSSPNSSSVWTSSGIYYDTLTNAGGCDSILQYNLTINQSVNNSITVTSCDSYTSPANNTYTVSGTYIDSMMTAAGCDSTITINLTISPSPTPTITFNGTDLSVANTYTSYEWKRNGTLILGANSNIYTPSQNGNYEIEVTTSDSCSGSDIYNLMNVTLADYSVGNINVYPNPTEAIIEIGMEAAMIQVRNLYGAILLEATDSQTMDVAHLANGIYTIHAICTGKQYIGKFVKQ